VSNVVCSYIKDATGFTRKPIGASIFANASAVEETKIESEAFA